MGIQSEEEEGKLPVIEKLEMAKAPGDDDDWTYKTPPPPPPQQQLQRPLKRARTSEGKEDRKGEEKKKLRWDRVVSVIRDDGNASGSAKSLSDDGKEKDGEELKSCIKTKVSRRPFSFFLECITKRIELINDREPGTS